MRHIATLAATLILAGLLTTGFSALGASGDDGPAQATSPAQSTTALASVQTSSRMKW